MKSYKQTWILGLILLFSACASTDYVRKTRHYLDVKEFNGIKHYKNGEYEQAFNLLKEPAAWGYKGSQYALAFMFLKGEYVEQSTLLGMGWLGVATETKVKAWAEQYDAFYNAATEEEKLKFDKIKLDYIHKYGLKAQNVTCRKSTTASTRRVKVDCHKYAGVTKLYEVELVEPMNANR